MATTSASRAGAKQKSVIPTLSWNEARPAPVVLVSGPEGVLAERAISSMRDALRARDPNLEVHDLDASDYGFGTLVTLASPSLFGEPRLIRVAQVEKCNDAFLEDALAYLEMTDESTTLVLRHAGGVRGKRLLDQIRAGAGNGIEVTCAELKSDVDLQDFARAEFARAAVTITPGALRNLVSAFAGNALELASACVQLTSDCPTGVDERTIEQYYGGRVETTAFKVADFAIAGRHGDALLALRHALDSGADPVPIVAAFAAKVRLMAKVWGDRRSSAQLAGELGAAPWQIDRARRDIQAGWDEQGLRNAIIATADADANVKGSSRDPVFALESLIGTIARFGRL